jgi:hypothetical protein
VEAEKSTFQGAVFLKGQGVEQGLQWLQLFSVASKEYYV